MRRSWSISAAAAMAALCGCNQVFGLDDSRPGIDAPGEVRDADSDAERDGDAPSDGSDSCTGQTICFEHNVGPQTAACATQPVATCLPTDWVYCGCGVNNGLNRTIFVFTNGQQPTTHADFVVIAEPGLVDTRLQVDGLCYGPPTVGCAIDLGVCAGSNRAVYRWNPLPATAGVHTVAFWVNDVDAPCTAADGGAILASWTVTRP